MEKFTHTIITDSEVLARERVIYHVLFFYLYYNQKRTAFRNPFDLIFVISRLFQKWCSSGVVSAISRRETIDFTGCSETFQNIAVADE